MRKRNTLLETTVNLQPVLDLLDPQFTTIQAAWRKMLATLGVTTEVCDQLSPLMLRAQRRRLRRGALAPYVQELERQSKLLADSRVSEAEIAAAYTLYFNACLPYLLGPAGIKKQETARLARFLAASELVALSSFSAEWIANRRKLQERDRQDLSRDLHDDIGHSLLVIKLYLEMMAGDLKQGKIESLRSKLQEALALVTYAVDSVRRLILGQGPAMLAQFGFLAALKLYARQFTQRTGIKVSVEDTGLPRKLPSAYETALYRVLKGALSNVIQHSQANRVRITIGREGRSLIFMKFEDNGVGFDLSSTAPERMFGLTAMRERIEGLGGSFRIQSWKRRRGARKHGTRIELELSLVGAQG